MEKKPPSRFKELCNNLPLDIVLGHMRAMTQRHRDDKEFDRELRLRYEQLVTEGNKKLGKDSSRNT